MEYARRIASGPHRALRVTKRALYRALEPDAADAILVEEARS